jgi:hypothetical protein
MFWLLPDGEQRVTSTPIRADAGPGRRRPNLVGTAEAINDRSANILRIFRKQICASEALIYAISTPFSARMS